MATWVGEEMDTNSRRIFLAMSMLLWAMSRAFWMSWWEYPWLRRLSISLESCGEVAVVAPGWPGPAFRSELILRGNGLGGLSGTGEPSMKSRRNKKENVWKPGGTSTTGRSNTNVLLSAVAGLPQGDTDASGQGWSTGPRAPPSGSPSWLLPLLPSTSPHGITQHPWQHTLHGRD